MLLASLLFQYGYTGLRKCPSNRLAVVIALAFGLGLMFFYLKMLQLTLSDWLAFAQYLTPYSINTLTNDNRRFNS
jgi:hypothetical protein